MRTTIYLRRDVINRLEKLAENTKKSKSEIIRYILRKVLQTKPFLSEFGKGITYQSDSNDFKRFHISFDTLECEINLDLKKIYKLSLSFIISLGIDLFHNDLHSSTQQQTASEFKQLFNSYSLENYIFFCLTINDTPLQSNLWNLTPTTS